MFDVMAVRAKSDPRIIPSNAARRSRKLVGGLTGAMLVGLGIGLNFVPLRWGIRAFHAMELWPEWLLGAAAGIGIVAVNALGPDGVAPFIYFQF